MTTGQEVKSAKKSGRKIEGFVYKRGGVWYARWTAYGKEERRSTKIPCNRQGSKADAEAVLADFIKPYKAEELVDVRAALVRRQRDAEEVHAEAVAEAAAKASRIPLAEAWDRFPYTMSQKTRGRTAVHPLSPRNVRENECAWGRFVKWAEDKHGEDLTMQDVTEAWAREYAEDLRKQGLTPSRRNLLILVARVMYRLASVSPCPFDVVDRVKPQAAESREPFTREQVAKLLKAASGEWRGFLAVLYFGGFRAGDGAKLRGEQRVGGKIRVRTSKTGAVVEVKEHPQLTAILDEVGKKKRGYLFPSIAEDYERNPAGLSARFTKFVGEVLGEEEEGEDGETRFVRFETTAERSGGVRRVSRWGLHSLRHSFATHAAQAGMPLAAVQKHLGHASEAITQIYANHETEEQAAKLAEGMRLNLDDAEQGEPAPSPSPAPANPKADALAALLATASPEQLAAVAKVLKGGGK